MISKTTPTEEKKKIAEISRRGGKRCWRAEPGVFPMVRFWGGTIFRKVKDGYG